MSGIYVIITVFILFFCVSRFTQGNPKEKRRRYLEEKFGTIPEEREWNKKVRFFYDLYLADNGDRRTCFGEKSEGARGVDDVTWEDLSMDEVFRRIDQCDTSAGEQILYWRLRRNDMSTEERDIFEKRVCLFASDPEERIAAEELLCGIGKAAASYYIPQYMDAIDEYRMKNAWLYRLLQILLLLGILGALILRRSEAYIMLVTVCIVNLALYTMLKMKYEIELQLAGPAVRLLETGKALMMRHKIAELFPELKKELPAFAGAVRGERLLRAQKAGTWSGDAAAVFLDYFLGITLWQITTYNKVMKKLSDNAERYLSVFRCVGEIDAAVSVASFRKSLPLYCTPRITEEPEVGAELGRGKRGTLFVNMEDLYHPLIKDPVENSLRLGRGCLITGSNASGKSTFIKAVAVNAILAQSLNTCAASFFEMPAAQVITSMAVKDDLLEGESYFIREIKYLKRILDSLTEERMTLCAVDEILRGTNTGERIRASRAILAYLSDKNCIPLVASHDKELTELMKDEYDNYHFSEEIGEDDIKFSYKIQKGPATSQNAVKLLEFAGFPAEIIQAAQK